jgi:spermidine/putrescine transport system ATP-binding protein
MQLELKRIQHEVGITFVHVTHDQEEAMTMADAIAVMNEGRIEQLGTPTELYETPRTRFVAGFLGISNMLQGTVESGDAVRLDDGTIVRVPAVAGRTGPVAIGIRPEKVRLGGQEENHLAGEVRESAYIGVSTQYIVDTRAGALTLYVQNAEAGAPSAQPGDQVTLNWSPDATFVVDRQEEKHR